MIAQLTQNPDSTLNALPIFDSPTSVLTLSINLGIGIVLAMGLRWHFDRFASTLSNREQFKDVFPFVLLTTLLIITIVKSSLALSLGLVGALSIVRFRTPIKEPEELSYLFIAIAMGLGLGANQTIPTIVAALLILGVMAAIKQRGAAAKSKNLYISVDWRDGASEPGDRLDTLNTVIANHSMRSDLRRFDVRNGSLEATYFVDLESNGQLTELVQQLRRDRPEIGITFIDQNQLPSV